MRGLYKWSLCLQFICLFSFIVGAIKGIEVNAWLVVLWIVNSILHQLYVISVDRTDKE